MWGVKREGMVARGCAWRDEGLSGHSLASAAVPQQFSSIKHRVSS
jgi:hypothetical protein